MYHPSARSPALLPTLHSARKGRTSSCLEIALPPSCPSWSFCGEQRECNNLVLRERRRRHPAAQVGTKMRLCSRSNAPVSGTCRHGWQGPLSEAFLFSRAWPSLVLRLAVPDGGRDNPNSDHIVTNQPVPSCRATLRVKDVPMSSHATTTIMLLPPSLKSNEELCSHAMVHASAKIAKLAQLPSVASGPPVSLALQHHHTTLRAIA
jgi:hypothetical protein